MLRSARPTRRARTFILQPSSLILQTMLRALFVIFFLFVLNRVVFGSHQSEKNPWRFLFFITPPVLLFFTLLFQPLGQWIDRLQSSRFIESITPDRFEEMAWSI